MQVDGIKLLRFTLREMGIPEHKVRNAIRYLRDENALVVSKGAIEAAIASGSDLTELYTAYDRPLTTNHHAWHRYLTTNGKPIRIRDQWCVAQLRRLITNRRIGGAKIFYGVYQLSKVVVQADGEHALVTTVDIDVEPMLVMISDVWIWLDELTQLDRTWLENWWGREALNTRNPQVSTHTLYRKLGVLK